MYPRGLRIHFPAVVPMMEVPTIVPKTRTAHHQVRWPWKTARNLRKKKRNRKEQRNEGLTAKRQLYKATIMATSNQKHIVCLR